MAKMYLSEEEAAQAIGVDHDALMEMVNEGKLQMYRDGAKNVFKSDDIESVTGSTDTVLLEEADLAPAAPETMRKEDTVITAQGISIFDDEDLEIEEALNHPSTDMLALSELKRRKLVLKDEIARLKDDSLH